MKFLVDESVEIRLVKFLRVKNFDTTSIAEISPSIDDKKVLDIANKEKRILITNDKDFGELVFCKKQSHFGVVLLRFEKEAIEVKIRKLFECIKNKGDGLENNFTVVTEKKIRARKK